MDKILAVLKSEQIMGTGLVVLLVILNRKMNLNLTVSDLAMIVGSVGALVLGESHRDAMAARAAAIAPDVQKVAGEFDKPKA